MSAPSPTPAAKVVEEIAERQRKRRGLENIPGQYAEAVADCATVLPYAEAWVRRRVPTREELVYAIASTQWKILYGDRLPPMWMMVEAKGEDGSEEYNFLKLGYECADAILALLTGGEATEEKKDG